MSKRKSRAVVPVRKPPLLPLSGAEVKLGEIIDGMYQRDHGLQTALRSGNVEVVSVALAAALARDPNSAAWAYALFGKDLDAVNHGLREFVLDMVAGANARTSPVRDDDGNILGARVKAAGGEFTFFAPGIIDHGKGVDADSDDVSDADVLALAAEHGDCTFSEFAKLADEARAEEVRCERDLAQYEQSMETLRPYMEHFPNRTVGEAQALYAADVAAGTKHDA
jgi:hypothetical protein